ncbi:hypothetical protein [Frigidibacter sp. MR17.24]|uniref:hypothetical protein n=1 Tax=Frigidibacter sp. MR17.24 TaxID=3127345 RepID=UPI0030130394
MDERPEGNAAAVRRRRVFYIPGYDPFHPRRYRELYRKEAQAQAALSGYDIALVPRAGKGAGAGLATGPGPGSGAGGGRYGWRVEGRIEGAETRAEVEVLVWSDLVRASMGQSIAATYGQLARTAWIYLADGTLLRLARLRGGPIVAALYPVAVLLGQLLAALAGGAAVAGGLGWALGRAGLPAWGAVAAATLAGAALAVWALVRFKRLDHRLYAYYLMHDYAFGARGRGANPPALEARLAAFTAAIRAALDEDWDEVLVVGHSSGAHLAVSALADLIRAGVPDRGPALSFLSLGQVVPMVSFLPGAGRLRADLRFLSARDELVWIDVTAPGDGCAFALCDPVAVTGVAPPGQRWPLVLSAAFSQTLSPARWAEMRRQYFRLHFQYLSAFDNLPGRPDDYDYFRITAGPRTLAGRLGGRSPSPSRITRACARHRSLQ